jgi:CRISPR-associated protein Csd1
MHLRQTYDNNEQRVGQFERNRFGREYALIPVSHTTQSAHIEILLSLKGELIRAEVVDKEDANTIIPCTEDSASRTSAPVPYPLFDKLLYVAGDYTQFCGEVKGTPHADYMNELRQWCQSPDAHPKVRAVYAYLSKGTLIADLIERKNLWTDAQGRLLDKWTPEAEKQHGEKPKIFRVLAGDQSAAFVRFAVEAPGESESRLWRDPSVQLAYIRYMEREQAERELCYATGKWEPCVDKHASRIRSSGDKSKLISANDSLGFTYRGRFKDSREAATISFSTSHKAHNALKWLIERQGVNMGGRVFVVWGTDDPDAPAPHAASFSLYDEDVEEAPESGDPTRREFAERIRKALSGYRSRLMYNENVIIMVLDAATTGRMSVVYYRDMDKELFLDRLEEWHLTCYWLHRYAKNKEGQPIVFPGAPATRDIAFAAYGSRVDEKVEKGLLERMLPCIVDRQPIPGDIVRSAVNRASNPVGMEPWEWEKTLSIACALVNKTKKGEYEVSLDTASEDRNYLFGRMLAIADVLERSALSKEERRASNAIRYMNAFAQHPARTWSIIQKSLQPYQARLGTKGTHHNRLLDEVGAMMKPEDFTDKPLSGLYLLGFYSQRHELYKKKAASNGAIVPGVDMDLDSEEDMDE